jgi:hypothetical protein
VPKVVYLTGTGGYVSNMQIQYVNLNTWHDVCGNITLYSNVMNSRFATDALACHHDRSWTAIP